MLVALLGLYGSVASAFNLTPPSNEWSRTGSSFELVCSPSEPITTCSWDTPYEKNYNLKNEMKGGLKAESGRLQHFSAGENDCGLRISKVEAKDDGVWACNVGVAEDGEVNSAKDQSRLNIAQKPASVRMSSGEVVKVEDNENNKVACVAEEAMPEPSFAWYLGEELLEDADVDTQQTGNTWEQTLRYKAKAEHQDLNLTCKVAHIGFEDGDVTSASALVNLTPEFVKMLADGSEDGLNADASVSKQPKSVEAESLAGWAVGLIVAVALIVVLTAGVAACFRKRFVAAAGAGQTGEATDGEKDLEKAPVTENENEGAPEGDNDNSEKKPSEPKEEEAPVPAAVSTQVALKDRLLAFFKRTTNQDKPDSGDVEAANLTAEDACDQGSTEQNTEEKVNDTSKISVVVKSGRFSIRKMFSFGKSSATKAESNKTPETEDKEEKVEESEKKEGEEEKMEELEPEDKPDPLSEEPTKQPETLEKTEKADEKSEEVEKKEEEKVDEEVPKESSEEEQNEEKPAEEEKPSTPPPAEAEQKKSPRHTPV